MKSWWILKSYRWLKFGDIKGETESTIVAAQDQAISTNYFKNKIFKEETESKCRLCKQHEETIDHLPSGCPILAKNKYLMRHEKFLISSFRRVQNVLFVFFWVIPRRLIIRRRGITQKKTNNRHDKVCTHLHYSISQYAKP